MLAKIIEKNLHLITLFLSGVFSYIAFKVNIPSELVLLMFIFFVTCGLICASIWDAHQAEKNNKTEFKHLLTFLTGKLHVKNIGKQLTFTANLLVVEHPSRDSKLKNRINVAFKNDVKKNNLLCRGFAWSVPKIKIDDVNYEIDWDSFKRSNEDRLIGKIETANSIVVVMSKDFKDKANWVYQVVTKWAHSNPDLPVLFVKPEGFNDADMDDICKLYFLIDEDATTIPWRLLQRSSIRTSGWGSQADFNRMFWKYGLSYLGVLLGLLLFQFHENSQTQRQYFNYRASVLKDIFEREAINQILPVKSDAGSPNPSEKHETNSNPDSSKSVQKDGMNKYTYISIWKDYPFNWKDSLFQEGSSDPKANYSRFSYDSNTVVGCAFMNPNHFVAWDEKKETPLVFENGKPIEKTCLEWKRPHDTLSSIACFVFNTTGIRSDSIGVCLKYDARAEKVDNTNLNLSFEPYQEWLSQRTQGLSEELKKEDSYSGK